ncbi:hypothetical protein MNNICLKF_00546 [Synechococcus sp. CBW1107]|nr:hypothetical protein MNNICLKF_00546 [Synechococcus sp. CBW1107]
MRINNSFVIDQLDMSESSFRLNSQKTSAVAGIYSRKPQRITITLPWSTYQALLEVSDEQGRSLSNTAAYWLERQSEAVRH